MLKDIHRRITKLILGLEDPTYDERLGALQLPTLAYVRMWWDLIELYTMMKVSYFREGEMVHSVSIENFQRKAKTRYFFDVHFNISGFC